MSEEIQLKELLALNDGGVMDKLLLDYLSLDHKLRPYYVHEPSLEGVLNAVDQKKFSSDQRNLLAKSVIKQYEQVDIPAPESVQHLLRENTFTITTGHQLCLFGGPLYLIYKICSCIKTAQQLNQKQDKSHFVPVFWLASEDHDVEEISSFKIFQHSLRWNTEQKGAVGRFHLHDLQELLQEIQQIIGQGIDAQKFYQLINQAYKSNRTLAQATRVFLHELFSQTDLLILDGDDAALKSSIVDLFCKDIQHDISDQLMKEACTRFEELGYEPQIKSRGVHFFHITESGYRERVIKQADGSYLFEQSQLVFNQEALIAYFKTYPERCSPNVVMRPLYQEFILPNVAVICGPSEIRYWLQLKSLMDKFSIAFPVVLLRDIFLLLSPVDVLKWEGMGFSSKELFQEETSLIQQFISKQHTLDLLSEKKQLDQVFSLIHQKLLSLDSGLESYAQSQKKSLAQWIDTSEKKMQQITKRKHQQELDFIHKIKQKYSLPGMSQDRSEYFSTFFISHSSIIINSLIRLADVFLPGIKVLDYRSGSK